MPVKLRYVELEPDKIFNWLDPKNITCWNAFPAWRDTWWEPEIVELREEFGKLWTNEFDKITGHFSKLEESILKDGIHHPVCVVSGINNLGYFNISHDMFPKDLRNDQLLHTRVFGGSRLTIASKHNIKIPCAIHDFSEMFNDHDEITHENYDQWFNNNYMFIQQIPYLRLMRHTHITDKEYNGMNNATRAAQTKASLIAKETMNV